jgi:hypothetical protein
MHAAMINQFGTRMTHEKIVDGKNQNVAEGFHPVISVWEEKCDFCSVDCGKSVRVKKRRINNV